MPRTQLLVVAIVLTSCSGGVQPGPATGTPSAGPAKCSRPGETAPDLLAAADLKQVAHELATDCLDAPWATRFNVDKGRPPALRFYRMRNRTSLHLDVRGLARMIEEQVLRSNRVKLVADLEAAGDLREERLRGGQPMGNEIGSDFIFTGWITEMSEKVSPTATAHAFTFAVELLGVDDNRKVWVKTFTVKKIVEKLPPCPPK